MRISKPHRPSQHRPGRQITTRLMIMTIAAVAAASLTVTAAQASRPPSKVTDRNATITNVGTQGKAKVNYAIVNSGTNVTVTGNYASSDTSSNIDQIQIGWQSSSAPLGCIYNGTGKHSGTFKFTLGHAPAGPINEVIINFAQDFSCDTSNWFGSNQGPAIAEVVTTPAQSGSSGPVSVSNLKIVGHANNVFSETLKQVGQHVKITGSYSIGDTGGAITQVELGWEGTTAPAACAFSGVGPASGTFTQDLGPAPFKGANLIVVDYAQNLSCNTNGWWGGSSTPPQTAEIGVAYNPTH